MKMTHKIGKFIDTLTTPKYLVWWMFITIFILSVATRIFIPSQPEKNLVFDESYFVPQVESYVVNRYFYDPHPPLAKMLMYYGTILVNPDAANLIDAEKLGNKVDDYKTPLDLRGIRLAPRIAGTLVPLIVAGIVFLLLQRGRKRVANSTILTTFAAGVIAVFSNILIVESRFALQTQILLLFMLLTVWAALKYFYATRQKWVEIWFGIACLVFGMSISVKWLAFSGLSVFVLLIFVKEVGQRVRQARTKFWPTLSIVVQRFVMLFLLAGVVYTSVFIWHFDKMRTYAPAANETSESHQNDLLTGTRETSFVHKFIEWHQLALKYEKHVPELDYGKEGEIGSMWVTWPIMARPISYYWQTDGDGLYDFVYLIGNPITWLISLIGTFGLSALGFARTFGKNSFRFEHFLTITLYFANWLPYAIITRVMYLYHFVPALVFGVICFTLLVQDFIYPRLQELILDMPKRWRNQFTTPDNIMFILGIIGLIIVMLGFFWFAPFTYLLPLSEQDFNNRVLMKEWNMEWPG